MKLLKNMISIMKKLAWIAQTLIQYLRLQEAKAVWNVDNQTYAKREEDNLMIGLSSFFIKLKRKITGFYNP